MTLPELISLSNSFTDESLSITNGMNYANAAIALINSEVNLDLPFFESGEGSTTFDYVAIPKKWIISLIGNYMNYSVKMNDGSLREAEKYENAFYNALSKFKDQAGSVDSAGVSIINDAYKTDGFGGVFALDTSDAIDSGWFGAETEDGGF